LPKTLVDWNPYIDVEQATAPELVKELLSTEPPQKKKEDV
jgi:hypothetical protein